MMRISLYEHELKIAMTLTVELTRLRQNECASLCVENVGPEIFVKLIDALYARGNYKHARYQDATPEISDFSEVD